MVTLLTLKFFKPNVFLYFHIPAHKPRFLPPSRSCSGTNVTYVCYVPLKNSDSTSIAK